VVPISQRPLMKCRGFCCVSPSFMRGDVCGGLGGKSMIEFDINLIVF
jgi:hypothetical protein